MARPAGKQGKGKRAANPRVLAAQAVTAVCQAGQSLSQVLPPLLTPLEDPRVRALAQELAYGTLRWYPRLAGLAAQLLGKPLKRKEADVHALLLVGLYQLAYLDMAAHAAVNETVQGARELGKPWAARLVNGVLRNYQRRHDELEAMLDGADDTRLAHPAWLLEMLRSDWPQHWETIAQANNQRPPMTLRVNCRQHSRAAYLDMLSDAGLAAHCVDYADDALCLERPVAVEQLPGFAEGEVSVQDAGAQLAAPLLQAEAGMRVLDACAAPGGKTAHVLERGEGLAGLTAVDVDAARVLRIEDNLQRLGLQAQVVTADAADTAAWWDGTPFPRILLDAPCSATGVIRRHPDIKSLRRASDLAPLAATQAALLEALWPLLAPGGRLLYVTCSVLDTENSKQIHRFLRAHDDAREVGLDMDWGHTCEHGRQILPGEHGMDGFYYACLSKC